MNPTILVIIGPGFRNQVPTLWWWDEDLPSRSPHSKLGRALGHFMFSLIGLKRIFFTNIFQKL